MTQGLARGKCICCQYHHEARRRATNRGSTEECGMILYIHLGADMVDPEGEDERADATRERMFGVIRYFKVDEMYQVAAGYGRY